MSAPTDFLYLQNGTSLSYVNCAVLYSMVEMRVEHDLLWGTILYPKVKVDLQIETRA